jgi:hypothetical protein
MDSGPLPGTSPGVWPVALAALSLGAASVHFAVSADHFSESWAHGTFFVALGWLQVGWALTVLFRPSRIVHGVGALFSAAVIAVWVPSRTVGIPIGPGSGDVEPIAFADALCAGFEAAIVVAATALVIRPSLARVEFRPQGFAFAATPLAVMVLSALALSPKFDGSHTHGHAELTDAHAHAQASDSAAVARDDTRTAAPEPHDHGEQTTSSATSTTSTPSTHSHSGTGTNAGIESATGTSPCEIAKPLPTGQTETTHGHRGPLRTQAITDISIRVQLQTELEAARSVTTSLRSVAAARAAGYIRSTAYTPCGGTHWLNRSLVDNRFDPAKPEMLLFDGNGDDAELVGLSYYVRTGNIAPEGFAGPNDQWHQHVGLCIKDGVVAGPATMTEAQCTERGGRPNTAAYAWMLHAWVVAGWENAWGTFAPENPELGAPTAHL